MAYHQQQQQYQQQFQLQVQQQYQQAQFHTPTPPAAAASGGYVAAAKLQSFRTRLVQRSVGMTQTIQAVLSSPGKTGHEVCLVAIPGSPDCCCCTLLTQVPTGPWALKHVWGKYEGLFDAGGYWCLPLWKGVSHYVTKQVVTFNAQPKSCPTKDTVFVDVDLSVNFRVGPTEREVKTFVFQMGAERLDAYLNFQVEDSIRSLVYGVTHDQVNDLRSQFSTDMLETLRRKATRFGVDVISVKITDVQLPRELQVRLESTTSFTTRLREGVKLHEHVLLQLANANEQKVAEIDQSFALDRKRISAETERYEIQMDEQLAAARSDRTVQIETARGAMKVAMTEARGEVEVAAFDARTRKTDVVASARIRCDKDLQEAKHVCMVQKTEAEGRKEAAEFLAKARVAEAKADGEVAKKTALKIKHEHMLRLAEIDAKIAGEGRKLLSGDAGAKILASLVSVRSELIER